MLINKVMTRHKRLLPRAPQGIRESSNFGCKYEACSSSEKKTAEEHEEPSVTSRKKKHKTKKRGDRSEKETVEEHESPSARKKRPNKKKRGNTEENSIHAQKCLGSIKDKGVKERKSESELTERQVIDSSTTNKGSNKIQLPGGITDKEKQDNDQQP